MFTFRGLVARSVIQAQTASPTFTHVYAALVAVVNTKVHTELPQDLVNTSVLFYIITCIEIFTPFVKKFCDCSYYEMTF